MTFLRMTAVLLPLLFICASVAAQIPGITPQSPVTFSGYAKYLPSVSIPKSGDSRYDHLLHQRFNLEYRFLNDFSFAASMRNRLFYGDSSRLPGYDRQIGFDPGYLDLSWNWLQGDRLLGNSSLDRIYLDWEPDDYKIRIGRHRIAWGIATLWNPNDLFNSYSVYDIDYTERPGTDALLLGKTLGFASMIESVWAFADNWERTTLAGRYQFNLAGYDFQLLAGKNRNDLVAGGGFAGNIVGAGLRGEISYLLPQHADWQGRPQQRSLVATIEADHTLPGKRNGLLKGAILYISRPENPVNALSYLQLPLTTRSLSFSRWTGYAEVAFDLSALSRQTLGGSLYSDGSWYLLVSNAVSLADNWGLLLVWQHFDGRSGSLFGTDPVDQLFARIQWSF